MTAPSSGGLPPPPPAPPSTAAPLLRRPDDRVLLGVCAALGRTTGTDPVLWRVVAGVLVPFGGSGLLLYVAGWLLIPQEGRRRSVLQSALRDRQLRAAVLAVAAAGTLVLTGLLGIGLRSGTFGDSLVGGGLAPLLALGLLAYVVLRREPLTAHGSQPQPGATHGWSPRSAPAPTPPTAPTAPTASTAPVPPDAGPPPPPDDAPDLVVPPPPVRRRRSALGPLTVGAALLTGGVLLALHALGVPGITGGRLLASALLVVGAGLLVGARWSRSRGLALLALPLALALGAVASLRVPLDLSAGQRTWPAAPGGSYALGVGEATLDLGPLAGSGGGQARVRLGTGHLVVRLPEGARLRLHARVTAGEVLVSRERVGDGTRLHLDRTVGPAGTTGPLVTVDAELGAGRLEVLP